VLLEGWCWIQRNPQLVAAFVALLAFMVAISQAGFARAHNRHSVTPWLCFEFQLKQDRNADGEPIIDVTWTLRNAGLGPAIIKTACISKNRGKYEPIEQENLLKITADLGLDLNPVATTALGPGDLFAKDQSQVVLRLNATATSDIKRVKNWLSRTSIQVKVEYDSLHRETFLLDNTSDQLRQRVRHWNPF
jgi:hypothetical protein